MHTLVPMESVYMESVLRRVERFIEQLNCVVRAYETEDSLKATECLHFKPFEDNSKASLSLRCLLTSRVIKLILCPSTETAKDEYFIGEVKLVYILHVLYEDKRVGTS